MTQNWNNTKKINSSVKEDSVLRIDCGAGTSRRAETQSLYEVTSSRMTETRKHTNEHNLIRQDKVMFM